MSLDIFNPTISKVSEGLEGKTMLIYGGNSVGKTKQASRLSKPYYLGFEKGLNAISGVPYHYIKKWSEFKKLNKQFTGKTVKEARERFDTIIFDTVDIAAMYCRDYVANQHGVTTISEGNNGFGLWSEYAKEFWDEIDALTSVGYTVAFIGHTAHEKTDGDGDSVGQIIPRGDVRTMGVVRDLVDIVVYVKSNGVDEDGNVILSTGYVREDTDNFFARSRYPHMPNVIDPFTAENLEEAIIEGIRKEEEAGGNVVSFKDFKEQNTSKELDFDELKKEVISLGKQFHKEDRVNEFKDLLSDMFGVGTEVKDLLPKQVEAMTIFIADAKELLESN